ncbi:MAG: glycosyltransferase family 2 protein [Ruminococcaceae bacterium]|nr:glycosyltransferase family 2 protein [Oscillospiraceae bacterium]
MRKLLIVVPCYNEQEVLPQTIEKLSDVLNDLFKKGKITNDSGLVLVNDGSRDKTWDIIKEHHDKTNYVFGVNLGNNAGHQNALLAGLEYAQDKSDITVTIDADLQDDTSVIEQMIDKYNDGFEVVYGVRNDRKTDSFFKRFTAGVFYKLMSFLGAKTVDNHADFRLMSNTAVKALMQYKERNIFLRGIVTRLGFKSDSVYYARKERTAGETKYPLRKMLSFAWEGITSLSIKPIKLIMFLGLVIMICSIIALAYVLISYFLNETNRGWASLMISIWFLGGVQLFSIGIVGQYVGKTYIETKERPRFYVSEILDYEKV